MTQNVNISIQTKDEQEAQKRAILLKHINDKLSFENLETLAKKAHKKGINERIKKYQNII